MTSSLLFIRDVSLTLHTVSSYEELARKLQFPQHIDVCNEKGERIEKKFFDFDLMGNKVSNISFC